MSIKLICSDIDGTLLQYGKKELESEIFEQIRELNRRGILFCPASGRQYTSLRKLFAPVADCCVFLCENGGVIYKDEQCIAKNPMPRALAEEIANDLWTRSDGQGEVMLSGQNTAYLMERGLGMLKRIGDEKTVLFLIMSDTDTTFNFILAMLQSQLINLLCDRADDKYGGRLPVHVRLILDEFANIGQIPNFDKLIATIRSREISASIILQSQSQLKAIYKDAAEIISDNCDSVLFLSGRGKNAKEISDALGKETIDSFNTSENRGSQTSHGLNYQKLGKELMQQCHFLFNQFPFLRRHGNAQHNLSGSAYHASPSFPFKGFGDFPNKQNGRGPTGAGRAVFSGVWLHSLCLLRYCFSDNKTFPNFKTTRKIDRWTEKSAKKRALARPHKKKTEDVFTHPPFLHLAI